jgi:hypothetical protein
MLGRLADAEETKIHDELRPKLAIASKWRLDAS